MEWNYGINPEDTTNYILDISELDSKEYSTCDLLDEVAILVGEQNINEVEYGIFSIDIEDEEMEHELNNLCKKFNSIFKNECN